MGDEEKQTQVDGGAGGEMQEITVVVGGLVAQGVVKVVQAPVTAGRQRKAPGGASTAGRGRKAGSRTPELAVRAIEVLTDGGLKLGEVVEALSGRCAVPRRTVSEIKRRIRERRKSAAIVEEAVKAARKRQREAAECSEADAVAAASRSYKNFGV
jgi:hypothetical protein